MLSAPIAPVAALEVEAERIKEARRGNKGTKARIGLALGFLRGILNYAVDLSSVFVERGMGFRLRRVEIYNEA